MLISTRLLALVIVPFLLGAFVILYFFPKETARLFAWPIKPTMTDVHGARPQARLIIGMIGLLALVQGLIMFVAPQLVMPFWPWSLTPLTCRVVGAIFCLGSAGLGVFADPRWSSVTMLLEVEMIMVPLMLIAAIRALRELHPNRVLTWLLGAGFVAILIGSIYLWVVLTARRRIPISPRRTGSGGERRLAAAARSRTRPGSCTRRLAGLRGRGLGRRVRLRT